MNQNQGSGATDRRTFLKTAGIAGFTTNLFTGSVRGANDRVAVGFIGHKSSVPDKGLTSRTTSENKVQRR